MLNCSSTVHEMIHFDNQVYLVRVFISTKTKDCPSGALTFFPEGLNVLLRKRTYSFLFFVQAYICKRQPHNNIVCNLTNVICGTQTIVSLMAATSTGKKSGDQNSP